MLRFWSIHAAALMALAGCDGDSPPRQAENISGPVNPITNGNDVENAGNETVTSPPTSNLSAPAESAFSPTGYRLIGTEPFWGGTVSADQIVYSTPDDQAGEMITVTRRFERDREIYSGSLNGRPFVLTLTAGPCSDGMSDNVHAFTASLEVDGEIRAGCANPRQ